MCETAWSAPYRGLSGGAWYQRRDLDAAATSATGQDPDACDGHIAREVDPPPPKCAHGDWVWGDWTPPAPSVLFTDQTATRAASRTETVSAAATDDRGQATTDSETKNGEKALCAVTTLYKRGGGNSIREWDNFDPRHEDERAVRNSRCNLKRMSRYSPDSACCMICLDFGVGGGCCE